MAETSLMSEGITLMLFGMGFVFVFLTLLVFATKLMSFLIVRYEDKYDDHLTTVPPAHANIAPPAAGHSKLLTIISAALHRHRNK